VTDETTQTQQAPPSDDARVNLPGTPYLVVLSGARAGEMFRLTKPNTTVGRSEEVDVRLLDDGVSRRHAVIVVSGAIVSLRDLDSANGTYRNGARIAEDVPLADGDKISMGGTTILKFTYQDALEEQFNRQLYEAAVRDGLTKVHKRGYFEDRLRAEMTYALRHQTKIALMIADIDHFKRVNDERGHPVGDATLREVARRMAAALRGEDVLARYGGEEFAILCRDVEGPDAKLLAERIRGAAAHELEQAGRPPLPVRLSVGIAIGPGPGLGTFAELVAAADAALYAAKRGGRDRSVVFAPETAKEPIDK
jgi:two-component system cell cycle response regulator